MSKKGKTLLTITLERVEVALLSHAVMNARREAMLLSKDKMTEPVLQTLIKTYGDILNKLESAPLIKL